MKHVLAVLFVLAVFTSCSQEKQVKIGFLLDDYDSERWVKDRDLFVLKVEELGGKVLVKSAGGNFKNQVELARKLFKQAIDILVLVPTDGEKSATIVELAHKEGIKVIAYDRLVTGCDLDFYLSFDNLQVGLLQARSLTRVLPQGKYIIIAGAKSDHNSHQLLQGNLLGLQPFIESGKIDLVYQEFSQAWSVSEGYRQMQTVLNKGIQPGAVIAANDVLATGVVQALAENNLTTKVLIAGQDAETEACKRILAGAQSMTVYKPIETLAQAAAIHAMGLARNLDPGITSFTDNGYKKVPSLLLVPIAVDQNNLELTVIEDGYLDKKDIFSPAYK